ncbi:GntR family transcriptional regulator [Pseudonocardia hierapolitana]|uniref:GntR family transcriptional regulator n=1 Tax=Pseudonocardia hierapolitana TaxID=1128676 RepID=A0A561SRL0_9PSEU|nr:GntR family transcriptional regulator [Pseudonocardia hierapolitana]TWF77482.1 GntR family transcriptional regulator [Pseudonocardia hierapolitana]
MVHDEAAVLPPLGRSTTRSDLVAASIKSAILSGRLRPDEVLVERRLADLLGVSKTPVREALIALTSSGLLTPTRNRGVAVRRLRPEDVQQVYEMRLLVEPWAAGQVAGTGTFDAPEAHRALDDAARFVEADDHAGLSLANRRFHRSIYSTCANELVVRSLDDLQDLTALGTVSLLWEQWPTWRAELEEHRAILAAVQERRAADAEAMMRGHIQRSITRLREERARTEAG